MNKNVIVITGPSGAGKTTLLNYINKECKIGVVKQTTTRKPRDDDNKEFFRFITLEDYIEKQNQKCFAISSGKNERRYGILKYDIMKAFQKNDTIVMIASYKEIKQIERLNLDIKIIVLTFNGNIEKWVKKRIEERNKDYSQEDIRIRSKYAVMEHEKYFEEIKDKADIIIFTDLCDIRQTANIVKETLQLEEKSNKINMEKEIGE